jgi:Ca2+-binding EF-hand superfamily protein
MEFKKGLIDKQLQGQLSTVFKSFDEDKKDALNYEQFCTFLYAVGMNFIVKEYEQMLIKQLFNGDKSSKRVRFD